METFYVERHIFCIPAKVAIFIWRDTTVGKKTVRHTWQRLFLCSAGICRTWRSLAPALNLNTACTPLLACCTTVKNANMHSCRIRWSLFKFACKSQLPDSSLLRSTELSSTQPYSSCRQGVGIYRIRAQVAPLHSDPVPHSDWIKDLWVFFQISPTRCTILLNIFISLLYMFRASMCPSSGKNYCIYVALTFVTLYGWRLVC